ncbi:HERV-H LTR-associating protein 2 [Labrus mixtus]|uniref:HERV-H LTR-associating protein 2 n=1 Tax=Labrus mixtus TaxID=508554 RepID=UPI0029BFB2A6|nr:HERV-H LTR-associating protein 2 [Labrus mixtus]XP_060919903.1 HERV-H LTR-associating protein 2 [Labrus mixtus]XP_060919904.1 HERV-H LTR-associating protein 2 [Labrus mixtus]XP_060919905.1 HERV-H LTR-associating protein 2 [Labrus mixtus]
MSAVQTWACFLLWISFATQDKTPDVAVTCAISEECVLPCSFEPGSKETVKWYKQDVVVYKFERDNDDDDDDDDGDDDSSEDHFEHEQLVGRASIFPHLISLGNATLVLRRTNPKDRGTYRCHVHTSEGEHNAKVIVKVEAPIRALSLELTRLSGYEEMKCTARDVFPAPRVTWTTEPQTFEDLRPVTRIQSDKQGLYMVDSRLRRLKGQPDLIYICRVTTSYGGPAWTASLREREMKGSQGRDLTIPCFAPPYLNNPLLHWTFTNSEDPSHIFTYDSHSGNSASSPPWENHVELDGMVMFGDGSLRLMDPKHTEHTGSYICVFSVPFSTHTERTDVTIDGPAADRSTSAKVSHWWIVGLIIALLILALAGILAFKKLKGGNSKDRNDPEEVTELRLVKDSAADSHLNDSSPLNVGGTNGQTGLQSDASLT